MLRQTVTDEGAAGTSELNAEKRNKQTNKQTKQTVNNNSFPKLTKYSVKVEVVGNNCKRPFSEYIRLLYNDSDNQILMKFIGTSDFSN